MECYKTDLFIISKRLLAGLILYTAGIFGNAFAHYPHDVNDFVALSPNFANDATVFISQKQASSVRPRVALVSRSGGFNWQHTPAGLTNVTKLNSAAVSPLYSTDKAVIMTTEREGVYLSVDAGVSWVSANQGLSDLQLHESAAGLDKDGNVVFYVSGVNGGLFRSIDYASTWQQIIPGSLVIEAFTLSPSFAVDHTLLAADATGLLYLSVNKGSNFSLLDPIAGVGAIRQIDFTPDFESSAEIYISATTGLYFSADGGTGFSRVDSYGEAEVSGLALSPEYRTDLTMFATNPFEGVYKSTDGGQSWVLNTINKTLSSQSTYHYRDVELSENFANDGIVFLSMFEGLFRSDNGGLDWLELDSRPAGLIYDIALSPDFKLDGKIIVSTYGGGMYVSEDAGLNWTSSNIGIPEIYTYKVKIVGGNGVDTVMISTQDNHTMTSFDNGASWVAKAITLPCLASEMDISPDYLLDQTMYAGCRKEGLVKTFDGGETWESSVSKEQMGGGSLMSVRLSPDFATDETLFFADIRGLIARSDNNGANWKYVVNGLPGRYYGGTAVYISPAFANDDFLLASTSEGLYGSLNRGGGWGPVPDAASPVASGVIETAGFSPNFEQDRTILASVRGVGLFRSVDGAVSWQQVGAGLLENGYQLNGFVFSPDFAEDGVIIGFGHDHMFRSTDRGDSFELFDIPFIRHDDDRKQSVNYTGGWGLVDVATANASSLHAANIAGRESSLSFWGTGVSWIGMRGENFGIADVYIDDSLVATIDQYDPALLWQQTLHSVNNLPLGQHEIRVVVTGTKNPASTDNWTIIDAFDVMR